MSRQGPRLHRLPKRTDYILIPPPLDLTLPLVDEKSPLPAIIVTPSSPSSSRDFAIAFLADPPKPSLRERFVSAFFPSSTSSHSTSTSDSARTLPHGTRTGPIALASDASMTDAERKPLFRFISTSSNGSSGGNANANTNSLRLRTRSIILTLLVLFVLLCHLVTHRLAVRGPFPNLDIDIDVAAPSSEPVFAGAGYEEEQAEERKRQGWLELLLGPFGVSSSSVSSVASTDDLPQFVDPDLDLGHLDLDLDSGVHAEPEPDYYQDQDRDFEDAETSARPRA